MTISRESAWWRYALGKKDKTQTQSPLKGTFAYGDRYMKYTVTALALCLNMADRPKRMSSAPKRFVDDFDEMGPANFGRVGKRQKIDKNLYEVNIVDVNNEWKQIKIHFVGFSEEFDGWCNYDCERDYFHFVRLEKVFLPNDEGSMEDRKNIFLGQLYRAIKRKLWSGRRDDPEVRIEMNVDPDEIFHRTCSSHSEHFTTRKRCLQRNWQSTFRWCSWFKVGRENYEF